MTDQAHPATTGQPLDLGRLYRQAEAAAMKGWAFDSTYFGMVTGKELLALVAELRAAREATGDLAWALSDLMDWARRTHGGDPTLHPEEFYRTTDHAQRALDDHDTGRQ